MQTYTQIEDYLVERNHKMKIIGSHDLSNPTKIIALYQPKSEEYEFVVLAKNIDVGLCSMEKAIELIANQQSMVFFDQPERPPTCTEAWLHSQRSIHIDYQRGQFYATAKDEKFIERRIGRCDLSNVFLGLEKELSHILCDNSRIEKRRNWSWR